MKNLILIALLSLNPLVYAQSIINITNGEWEPYHSQFSYQYGFDSHVVSESFKLEGIAVNWGFFPWKRAFHLAKNGKEWQASAAWWPSDKTKADFLISDPISNTSFVFFHLKSRVFDWSSVSDLNGLRVGGTLEYNYGREFMDAMHQDNIDVQLVASDELNYKKLLNDRIDIFPNDLTVGYSQIRNSVTPQDVGKFTHHPLEFEKTTLHLIISKQAKNAHWFIKKFNAGLKKLKATGKHQEMFNDLKSGKYDKNKTKWHKKSPQKHRGLKTHIKLNLKH